MRPPAICRDSSAVGSKEKLNTTTTRREKNSMELMASFDRHSRRRSLSSVARVMPVGALISRSLLIHPNRAPFLVVRVQVARALHNLAVFHPDELIGRAFQQRGLVGDDEDRLALIAETGQESNHLRCRMNVDVREGLVEQKNLGIVEQCSGQRHALPHTLRILADGPDELGIKTDSADNLCAAGIAVDSVQASEVSQ